VGARQARALHEFFFENLRNAARVRRAGVMRQFPTGQVYSSFLHTAVLKMNGSKFTRGLDPLYSDACSAKSFKVLALIFRTDCSPIDWLQSVLKIKSFENLFLFFLLFEHQASRLGEEDSD
jgi:hypothetical protein